MKKWFITVIISLFICSCGGGQGSDDDRPPDSGPTGKAFLSGDITDTSGKGIPDASVTLTDKIGIYWRTKTDQAGHFERELLLAGNIKSIFSVAKTGYKTYNENMVVSLNGNYHRDIVLEPQ